MGDFWRQAGQQRCGAIKTALRHLKAGCKLLIFPEGTRVKEGEENDGKTGAIMLALRTGTPILPLLLRENGGVHSSGRRLSSGEPYMVEIAGKRATPKEYRDCAEDLIGRIYALKEQLE